MAKYDSPRKSVPTRASAAALSPQFNYVPTVCRTALDEDAWRKAQADLPAAGPSVAPVSSVQNAVASAMSNMEFLGADDDEPLPVPEMGVPKETQIVARRVVPPPIPAVARSKAPFDPMAMLEAATVWGKPRRDR